MISLCHYSDIDESSSKGFSIKGYQLFVVKRDGALFIYHNHCPHLGINLEFMPHQFLDSEKQYILCSNHGAEFQIEDGLCISGPCVNSALTPIPFEIKESKVYVDLAPLENL